MSDLDGTELGLVDDVVILQEPKTIDETEEPQEFFEGTLHTTRKMCIILQYLQYY